MDSMEFEILASQLFGFFCFLFICFRIIAFNFFWKSKKRKLSLIYDACLIVATTAWLVAIIDIWQPIKYLRDNSITQFAAVIYIFAICDVFYNWYNLKQQLKEEKSSIQ